MIGLSIESLEQDHKDSEMLNHSGGMVYLYQLGYGNTVQECIRKGNVDGNH